MGEGGKTKTLRRIVHQQNTLGSTALEGRQVCVHPIVPYFSRGVVAQLTRPSSAPEGCARHTTLVQGTRAPGRITHRRNGDCLSVEKPCVVAVALVALCGFLACGKPCKAIRRPRVPS